MATLKEYYRRDFVTSFKQNYFLLESELEVIIENKKLVIPFKIHLDFNAGVKYISFYFSNLILDPLKTMFSMLHKIEQVFSMASKSKISFDNPGETKISSDELIFSKRVYFYVENIINEDIFDSYNKLHNFDNFFIQYRDLNYSTFRSKNETPLAFISHDSRDKKDIAGLIADELQKKGCIVWYDEYSLKVGDSLRESIEKGIKECHKCILILSPHFLSNSGWTKAEFNSIFTRELIENKNLILPVWCGVSKKEIYNYSPVLADRVAVMWEKGIEEVIKKLFIGLN